MGSLALIVSSVGVDEIVTGDDTTVDPGANVHNHMSPGRGGGMICDEGEEGERGRGGEGKGVGERVGMRGGEGEGE